MLYKIFKIRKFLKETQTINQICKIISNHTGLKEDDDKVVASACEIYEQVVGKMTGRIDP